MTFLTSNFCCAGCSRRVQRSFYLTVIYYFLFSFLPIIHRHFKRYFIFCLTQCSNASGPGDLDVVSSGPCDLDFSCDLCMSHIFGHDIIDHEEKRTRIEFAKQSRIPNDVNRDWFSLIDGGNHHCLIDACRDLKSRKNSQNNSRLFASPFITQILFFWDTVKAY